MSYSTEEEMLKDYTNNFARHAKLVVLATVCAITMMGSFTVVSSGHRGVITTFGRVNDRILGEGIHLKLPIADTVHKISVRIEKYAVEAQSSSKDLQHVKAEITLNFHINPGQVGLIYQNIGDLDTLGDKLITPLLQEAVKASTANFTAEELITKRPIVRDLILSHVDGRLQTYGISVDDLSITHFDFSTTFNQAIEAKVTAEQNFLKAQRDLDRIKVEAAQKIEGAKAEAESLKLQKNELTPELIKLREIEMQREAIQKWDGKLPGYTGGSIPFINVK